MAAPQSLDAHRPADSGAPAPGLAAEGPAAGRETIPIIDLSHAHLPDVRPGVVEEVTGALSTVGAFYAVGTLVQPSMISAVADAFRPFFEDWPESSRAGYAARDDDGGARGYLPRFSAAENPTAADELRSFIWHPYDRRLGLTPLLELGPDEHRLWNHPNPLPDLPGAWNGLRVLAALFAAVRGEVLALLEEGLDWAPGRFAGWLGHGDASTVVVNHYQRRPRRHPDTSPGTAPDTSPDTDPDTDPDGGTCLSPHTDLGGLTINALDGRSGIEGLYYRGWSSGQWLPAPEPPPGALPVFAGRLLQQLGVAHAFEHYVHCTRTPGQPNRMSVVGFGQPGVTRLVATPTATEPFGRYYMREIGRGRLLDQPEPSGTG